MAKLALVFPGQGSQAVGMGAVLARESDAAAEIYHLAGEILGWDVASLSFNGPEEKLNQTTFAQAALYVNSAAVMSALRERGVAGEAVLGHSLGEYSALEACGAFDFETGLRLVARRGEVMSAAAAARPGSMAAILGMADAQVEAICEEAGDVWPVNYNSPGQLVISGEKEVVQLAIGQAKTAGAKKAVELAVSGAFHSPLMQPAAAAMRETLATIRFSEPRPPFFSSISCDFEDAAALPQLLVNQITSPVRWRTAVEKLIAGGFDRFLEVGNGKILSGLIRRIDRGARTASASDLASIGQALEALAASG